MDLEQELVARYGPLYADVHILLLASLPATVLPFQPSYRPKADRSDREMLTEDVCEDREEATEEEEGAEVDEEQSDDSLECVLKGGHCGVELRAEQTSRLERDLRYQTSQACLSRRIELARLGPGRSELLRFGSSWRCVSPLRRAWRRPTGRTYLPNRKRQRATESGRERTCQRTGSWCVIWRIAWEGANYGGPGVKV